MAFLRLRFSGIVRSNKISDTYITRPALRYNSSFRCDPPWRIAPHSGIFTAIGAIRTRILSLEVNLSATKCLISIPTAYALIPIT